MVNRVVILISVLLLSSCVGFNKPANLDDLKSLVELAQKGNKLDEYNVGVSYYKGYGTEVDYNKAAKWLKKSAAQGFSEAQYNLGLMYIKGHGVEQNYSLARKYNELAAQQGVADAQHNLGLLYLNGLGVEKRDLELGMKLIMGACQNGSRDACAVSNKFISQ